MFMSTKIYSMTEVRKNSTKKTLNYWNLTMKLTTKQHELIQNTCYCILTALGTVTLVLVATGEKVFP